MPKSARETHETRPKHSFSFDQTETSLIESTDFSLQEKENIISYNVHNPPGDSSLSKSQQPKEIQDKTSSKAQRIPTPKRTPILEQDINVSLPPRVPKVKKKPFMM